MINGKAEVREIPLELEPRDVWAIMGNPDRVLPSLSPDIDESITLARELCEPRDVLPGDLIGVELLESSFLRPQKSQSALVPIGPVRKEPQIVTAT